jgi:flagellar biosynthesis/type III secretory pathway M-ring protein FliF/YscJ
MTFLTFLNKYWWMIAAGIGIFILIFLGNRDNRLIELVLKKAQDASRRHEEQRKAIAVLKEEERQQKASSEAKYREEVKDLSEKHRENSDKIDQKAINNVLNQREMTDEEIAELARKMKNRFGI